MAESCRFLEKVQPQTIDHGSDVPLVEQIVQGIQLAIANGTLPSGVELPPVRQLANDLAVNLNTVSRA